MATLSMQPVPPDSTEPQNPEQAAVEKLLTSWGEQAYTDSSRYRWAEEREWYEQALFYQRRQWLRWNDAERRYNVVTHDPDRPKPMPVSNYFALAVNSNANQLQKPRMTASARDSSDAQRRAAEYGQSAIAALDKETGFDVLLPLLAKHVPLWGMGITKDVVDTAASNGERRIAQMQLKRTLMVSCLDCGQSFPVTQPGSENGGEENDNADVPENVPCPNCGGKTTIAYRASEAVPAEAMSVPNARLCTEIPPVFEVYLPRDCRNPNFAKRIIHRYRKPLAFLRDRYPDRAEDLRAESAPDPHQIYFEALKSLVNYNYMHEETIESASITEIWADWDDISKRVRDRLEKFWADDPQTLLKAYRQGIYMVYAGGGTMLDWGVNPWWDETEQKAHKPFTFFLWEVDPASTYPKGLATDLTPLQKRLNRLDSLVELALMSNSAGKWLWPTTQTTKPPSGTPNEVVAYDTIGDGKVKPEFVAPTPFHEVVIQVRGQILTDFDRLSNTLGVQQGQPAPGVKSFRGNAYLGAKAEENINTQRWLWEQAHALRYRKLLLMAQRVWSNPRKAVVAGYNGKFGMAELTGEMLSGDYAIDFVPDSSRPVLPSERKAAFADLLKAGMVDLTDSSTREYVIDLQNLDDVDLTDHFQYEKAERDLEAVKAGKPPFMSPFQKWDIALKVFANFTLTEEFEALQPPVQQAVLAYAQMAQQQVEQQQVQAAQAAIASAQEGAQLATKGKVQYVNPAEAGPNASALAEAMSKGAEKSPLEKVPGQNVSAATAQEAARNQGANIAHQMA